MDGNVATEGRITAVMSQYAGQMKPWVRLMSVLMFVGAGLMVLVGLGITLVGTLIGAAARESAPGAVGLGMGVGAMLGGVYIVMGALYFAPALFLSRTASAAQRMLTGGDQTAALEDVLKNQKSFWRFVGILTVIVLICIVLAFVVGVGAGILTGLNATRGQI